MIQTTFRQLYRAKVCKPRYRHLAKALGGIRSYGRDTPITALQILEHNGVADTLWALEAGYCGDCDKLVRLFAADCVEHVLYIWEAEYPNDKRPRLAVEARKKFARGEITEQQQVAALEKSWCASNTAPWYVLGQIARLAATCDFVHTMSLDAASVAAEYGSACGQSYRAAWDVESQWQIEKLKEYLR